MNTTSWKHFGTHWVVVLATAITSISVAAELEINAEVKFTAIEAQGTNLVLSASVPPGLQKVILEFRPSLEDPWMESAMADAPASGGPITFTIPKSGQMGFMRLKGQQSAAPSPTETIVSSDIHYTTLAPLSESANPLPSVIAEENGQTNDAVFYFKGMIDGSDKITIKRGGAFWEHINWGWPSPVMVNGQQWNPSEKNYLTTLGAEPLLPVEFSFADAKLEVLQGRDTVALEQTNNGLIVYIDDSPSGPGLYEFKIHFHRVSSTLAQPVPSARAALRIMADIDGSDLLTITTNSATWEHHYYSFPGTVALNGVVWHPAHDPVIKNEGTNQFLPPWVDLTTARITGRKGRDLVTMWATKDAVTVHFDDNLNGRDAYELDLQFGE